MTADNPPKLFDGVTEEEHQARLDDLFSQSFVVQSACRLAESATSDAAQEVDNELPGSLSLEEVEENVQERMDFLAAVDGQLERVELILSGIVNAQESDLNTQKGIADLQQQLQSFNAKLDDIRADASKGQEDIKAFFEERLEEHGESIEERLVLMSADLKDYIGSNVDELNGNIQEASRDVLSAVEDNSNKLDLAADVQQRILLQAIENREAMSLLSDQFDEATAQFEVLNNAMRSMDARFTDLHRYTKLRMDNIDFNLEHLSEDQQEALELALQDRALLLSLDEKQQMALYHVIAAE